MGFLKEICDSVYKHLPLTTFGKRYFRNRYSEKIICQECLDAYIENVSTKIGEDVFRLNRIVNMNSLTSDDILRRDENLSYQYDLHTETFMQYILPTIFKLNVNFIYERIQDSDRLIYVDPSSETYTNIQDVLNTALDGSIIDLSDCGDIGEELTISKSVALYGSHSGCPQNFYNADKVDFSKYASVFPEYTIKTIECQISPDDDCFTGMKFNLKLDIRNNDTALKISAHVKNYLLVYINSFYEILSDAEVQALMNKETNGDYISSGGCSSQTISVCCKCNINVTHESYLYCGNLYCLNCMYSIVIQECIKNNLVTAVGISYNGKPSSTYAIVETPEYKRAVIDKYILIMKQMGYDPKILRMYTCYH